MKEIILGTIGSGAIVHSILDNVKITDGIRLAAVYSRSMEKGRALAGKYGAEKIYTDMDAFLGDEEINTVYIATPNILHYEQTKKALLAGKHVICEKPFCTRAGEVRELLALARERHLLLADAVPTPFLPNFEVLKARLPEIGRVKLVLGNYSQYSSRYDNFKKGIVSPSFDPKNAGGALMDLNIYNIHFVAGLFGKPLKVRYCPNMERGVDTSGILMMEYPDFQAVCIAAKDCGAPLSVSVQGNKGFFHSDYASSILAEFSFQENKCEPENYHLADSPERLFYELLTFAKYYEEKDWEAFDKRLDHSLMVMEILDAARNPENQKL